MDSSDELVELEQRGWEALSTEGAGGTFYAEMLDDEPIMLLPGGMVLTDRAAMVEAMSGPPWKSFRLEDPTARMLTDDSGIVAYGVVARRPDGDEYTALMSSVYVRREAGWRLAFHQQTPR
ncbi:MAG TPA: nuclear transport factor 2 family protein [Ilumatobacteraceae bacterium]|nr:nuclear transport factor 2 family protein [Ilumatobacteraceae bacterium]